MKADPENANVAAMAEKAQKQRADGIWTVPTLLSEEKTYNVFMRSFDEDMQKICGKDNAIDTMAFLREWKNSGNMPNL